jgi:hypothetical protein
MDTTKKVIRKEVVLQNKIAPHKTTILNGVIV